jgi:hypothetical protein
VSLVTDSSRATSVVERKTEKSNREKRKRKLSEAQRAQSFQNVRVGDLTKVFGHRYGGEKLYQFPDGDDGRDDLRILLDHYANSNPLAMSRVVKARAPWMTADERDALLNEVNHAPRRWTAQALANELNLTIADRDRLGIRTIGAVDVTPLKRKQLSKRRKRDRDRERLRTKRRADRQATGLDPWQGIIAAFVENQDSVSIAEVLQSLGVESPNQATMNRVSRCLQLLGLERYRARNGHKREWRYRLGPSRSHSLSPMKLLISGQIKYTEQAERPRAHGAEETVGKRDASLAELAAKLLREGETGLANYPPQPHYSPSAQERAEASLSMAAVADEAALLPTSYSLPTESELEQASLGGGGAFCGATSGRRVGEARSHQTTGRGAE